MAAYYNEFDAKTAAWLRELIKAGLIADGEVDERSIVDVRADDLRGFSQCHFFAGIGGWSLALRLAGWPDDREVWTGSCPCQPFSSAGAQAGGHDPRDLWPTWFELVKECRPVVVFGEQVESAIAHGWLDRLCDDLEGEGYAVGAAGLPAPSVGAFHIRQRLWFVADAGCSERERWADEREPGREDAADREQEAIHDQRRGASGVMADAVRATGERRAGSISRSQAEVSRAWQLDGYQSDGLADGGEVGLMAYAKAIGLGQGSAVASRGNVGAQSKGTRIGPPDYCCGGVAYASRAGLPEQFGRRNEPARSAAAGFWCAADWIPCRDGKARPVEPGTFPLAHGVPARVGRLRGYGNAIVPQVAAEFIAAYLEA